MTVVDMIEAIRGRPGIILGRPSAQTLHTFLWGFCYARQDGGVDDFQVLSRFGEMVHDRFKITSTQGWAKIIEFYSVSADEEMKLFWRLWDEYCAKHLKPGKNGQEKIAQEKSRVGNGAAKAQTKRRA